MTTSFDNLLRRIHIYQKRNLKFDFFAALVVFMIAVPFCLGIALACGAPLFSGILSGIIGGIVVGSISGSQVSISGPAAGMALIVFGAIAKLGGFENFLVALFLAGILQVLAGYLRAGFLANYLPSNVIQGFLSAVGILLICKQLPFALTLNHSLADFKTTLIDVTSGLNWQPFGNMLSNINNGAMLISLTGLAVMLIIDKSSSKWLKKLPGAFVVVILGIMLNEFFIISGSSLAQLEPNLVHIPKHSGVFDFFTQLHKPNLQALLNPQVYLFAIFLATVSALENLVNIKASETLDKKHRSSHKDRELIAQGVGNICAGFLGGIPISSVIVRTSVNIQSGSRTKIAAILHGIFILLAILIIPTAINKIPLATVAAILIFTGYKLTSPIIYHKILKQGMDRFIPFVVTIIAVLCFNILTGIIIGLITSFFFILKSSSKARFDIIKEIYPKGETSRIVLPQQTTFLNKAALIAELEGIQPNTQLTIDARQTDFIDKEIVEYIKEFQQCHAPQKNIGLNLIGFKEDYQIHNFIDFINVTTFDVQTNLTPAKVLNILKEGNQRFINAKCINRNAQNDVANTAKAQHPMAVVLGCIDSRVPVETVFDMSFGDLFCVRIAGNVVNDDILASIEYACNVVGAKLIVVLGHTRCGAIKAACDDVEHGHITQLLSKIKPAIDAEQFTNDDRTGNNQHFVHKVTQLNIANTMLNICEQSPILQEMLASQQLAMVGSLYDVDSGAVHFQDFTTSFQQLKPNDSQQVAGMLNQVLTTANRDQ